MRPPSIKSILLQLHSIAGLTLSLFLAMIALSGAMLSFEDEILAALNADRTRVEVRATPRLQPDELIARLQAATGAGKIASITLARDTASAVHIRFVRNDDTSRPSSVYVDPHDARVLGHPVGEGFFATVRKLHRWLLLPGDAKGWGRPIGGIVALGLIAMLITGLVLRWPHRAGSAKVWLKPNLRLRGRGLHRSLHAVIGTWAMLIYLVMVLTGLWWSFDWYRDGAMWLLSSAPARAEPMRPSPKRMAQSGELPLDRVWSAFLQQQGDRFVTARLTLPAGGTLVRVRSWTNPDADGVRDELRIDALSGRIVSADLYAAKPLGDRILARVLDIHRGNILGLPGKLLFMLAALAMPLFVVTGLLLYLSRRRHKRLSQRPLGELVAGK
ncbi:PepSY-associated TM helix domain-containing protein [Rhodopseudomonas palustris]|uniref:PepSY-associated TM helix domain-containing protein n=1 Tax=Rhodopseudomonas palustris TaxID=1076 RepID=UPI002ACDD515|nr:PepSY-associated TM helix domain-containing protein [Rhodopseudomonas palustris]WQH02049.1 PepSY-associated TM helix domain-containing protein [Rhodopseudomonas palustris]